MKRVQGACLEVCMEGLHVAVCPVEANGHPRAWLCRRSRPDCIPGNQRWHLPAATPACGSFPSLRDRQDFLSPPPPSCRALRPSLVLAGLVGRALCGARPSAPVRPPVHASRTAWSPWQSPILRGTCHKNAVTMVTLFHSNPRLFKGSLVVFACWGSLPDALML